MNVIILCVDEDETVAIKSKELAEMLEVSTATMSLVLNNKPGISGELRKTLLNQIREMGYGYMIKDEEQSGDENPGKKKLVYLISETGNEAEESAFYPPVLEGAEREARKCGYQLSVLYMDRQENRGNIRDLGGEGYSGIIVQNAELKQDFLEDLEKTGIPYVAIDCYEVGKKISSVASNNEQGIYMAVKYLKETGHKSIGYVRSGTDSVCFAERHRFYRYAVEEEKIEWKPEYDINVQGWGAGAQSALEQEFGRMGELPDAFILETDNLAPPFYQAVRNIGCRIPEDISVVGFDGRAICNVMVPPLTTMRVHRRAMGRALIMLLCHKIEMKEIHMEPVTSKLELDVELVRMGSVLERNR